MKHGEGRDEAHDLYVYQQMTFDEIGRRIGRSDKTIRNWADEGGWREERERDLRARVNTHEQLHTLVQKLTKRMIDDCDAGEQLSSHSLHALNNIARALNSLYKYEGDVSGAENDDKPKQQITPEELAERVRKVLGV